MKDLSISTAESVEVPFGIGELFYSRTDKRGIIRTGNPVFQRISGYDWDRLLGAPHRLVRHPDTPKAIFRIFWQLIQQGEPAVAYVKNKTEAGGFYWVIATVLPLPDGYLSIRIKPTSPFFDTVRSEYAAVVAEERGEGLSAEVSAERLLKRLQTHGFADYQAFMLHALLQEFEARERAIKQTRNAIFADIDKVRAGLAEITAEQDILLKEFDRLRDLPTNMRIIASRLEPSGGPVSAISENYKVTSTDLSAAIKGVAAGENSLLKQMVSSYGRAVLLLLCARLQSEVVRQFRETSQAEISFDQHAEERTLADLARSCDTKASAALLKAEQMAFALISECSDIRRAMLGLDSIRVMGRVESGRMGAAGTRLAATIDQLDVRHAAIIKRLETILDVSATINAGMPRIRKQYDPSLQRGAAASH